MLSENVRNSVSGPKLLLYRSILETSEEQNAFNWSYIDAHENMFYHHDGKRIPTVYGFWLMNASDYVDHSSPDAMEHWCNYYAKTASEQVKEYNYDGVFVDSASHCFSTYATNGTIPDGYDAEKWYQGRVWTLQYLKSLLPDKIVIYNGLHSECDEAHSSFVSLNNTDGAMWEIFAFDSDSGAYKGIDNWRKAINLTNEWKDKKIISLVSKEHGLIADVQRRMFLMASYFLVYSKNVSISLIDLDLGDSGGISYYPEYKIGGLGAPKGDFTNQSNLYIREYENGLVLLNPDENNSYSYTLSHEFSKVCISGGGAITEDGRWKGTLSYEQISGEITIKPLGGYILTTNST